MNINNSLLKKRKLSPPPRQTQTEKTPTPSVQNDTVEFANKAKAQDDGMGLTKALGTMALLGVAALGATGCVPQEPSGVETTVPSNHNGSGEIDIQKESETPRSRTSIRSDGTISYDVGNGTKIRSDGTVGFDAGNGTTINSDGTVDFDLGNGFSINSDGGLNYNWNQ